MRAYSLQIRWLGAALALSLAIPAGAQNVPPRPPANTGSIARPAAPPPTTTMAAIQPATAQPGQQIVLDANQKALVDRVSMYLSSIRTLVGNFVQVGPDGSRTTGDFYLAKPGRIRFEYNDPSPIAIIADGSSLVVRDRKLATQDVYPLGQTPLRFLLANQIDLTRDTHLIGVRADDTFVSVTTEETQSVAGTSRLLLMFDTKTLQLKQWTVTDPQGYDTTVAVYNLDAGKTVDPDLFKIDYTIYKN